MRIFRTFLTYFILLAQLVYILRVWPHLPATIPNAFDAHGIPHRFAPRALVWVMLVMATGAVALLTYLQTKPQLINLPAAQGSADRPRQEAMAREFIGWLTVVLAAIFASAVWSIADEGLHPGPRPNHLIFPIVILAVALFGAWNVWRIRDVRPT
jgi:uncharacterized membrane protein